MKKTTRLIAKQEAPEVPSEMQAAVEAEQERQQAQRLLPIPDVELQRHPIVRKGVQSRALFPILRKGWLESLQLDPETNARLQKFFSRDELQMLNEGFTPPGWHVRHQVPLTFSGGNACENFVLIQHGSTCEKAGDVLQLFIDAQGLRENKTAKFAYLPIAREVVCSGTVELPPVTNNSRRERIIQVSEFLPADSTRSSLLPKPVPAPALTMNLTLPPDTTPSGIRRKTTKRISP